MVLVEYVRRIKAMYVKTLLTSSVISALAYLVFRFMGLNEAIFYPTVGAAYLVVFLGLPLARYFGMTARRAETIASVLFKKSMGHYMGWLLVFNPLFTKLYWLDQNGQFMGVFLFIHVFLLCFAFNFVALLRDHQRQLKLTGI